MAKYREIRGRIQGIQNLGAQLKGRVALGNSAEQVKQIEKEIKRREALS